MRQKRFIAWGVIYHTFSAPTAPGKIYQRNASTDCHAGRPAKQEHALPHSISPSLSLDPAACSGTFVEEGIGVCGWARA
jgi:hypothetical protein